MKKIIYVVLYFLSPFILIFTLYNANPTKYSDYRFLITMVIASMAYSWLIWQFVLSSRPKFIEDAFGMDKLYRIHGLMAIVSLTLAAIHGTVNEAVFGENFMTSIGSGALTIFVFISAITLLLMVSSALTNIKPFQIKRKRLRHGMLLNMNITN